MGSLERIEAPPSSVRGGDYSPEDEKESLLHHHPGIHIHKDLGFIDLSQVRGPVCNRCRVKFGDKASLPDHLLPPSCSDWVFVYIRIIVIILLMTHLVAMLFTEYYALYDLTGYWMMEFTLLHGIPTYAAALWILICMCLITPKCWCFCVFKKIPWCWCKLGRITKQTVKDMCRCLQRVLCGVAICYFIQVFAYMGTNAGLYHRIWPEYVDCDCQSFTERIEASNMSTNLPHLPVCDCFVPHEENFMQEFILHDLSIEALQDAFTRKNIHYDLTGYDESVFTLSPILEDELYPMDELTTTRGPSAQGETTTSSGPAAATPKAAGSKEKGANEAQKPKKRRSKSRNRQSSLEGKSNDANPTPLPPRNRRAALGASRILTGSSADDIHTSLSQHQNSNSQSSPSNEPMPANKTRHGHWQQFMRQVIKSSYPKFKRVGLKSLHKFVQAFPARFRAQVQRWVKQVTRADHEVGVQGSLHSEKQHAPSSLQYRTKRDSEDDAPEQGEESGEEEHEELYNSHLDFVRAEKPHMKFMLLMLQMVAIVCVLLLTVFSGMEASAKYEDRQVAMNAYIGMWSTGFLVVFDALVLYDDIFQHVQYFKERPALMMWILLVIEYAIVSVPFEFCFSKTYRMRSKCKYQFLVSLKAFSMLIYNVPFMYMRFELVLLEGGGNERKGLVTMLMIVKEIVFTLVIFLQMLLGSCNPNMEGDYYLFRITPEFLKLDDKMKKDRDSDKRISIPNLRNLRGERTSSHEGRQSSAPDMDEGGPFGGFPVMSSYRQDRSDTQPSRNTMGSGTDRMSSVADQGGPLTESEAHDSQDDMTFAKRLYNARSLSESLEGQIGSAPPTRGNSYNQHNTDDRELNPIRMRHKAGMEAKQSSANGSSSHSKDNSGPSSTPAGSKAQNGNSGSNSSGKKHSATCDDGIHCGTDSEEDDGDNRGTTCTDGIHCGTDSEDENANGGNGGSNPHGENRGSSGDSNGSSNNGGSSNPSRSNSARSNPERNANREDGDEEDKSQASIVSSVNGAVAYLKSRLSPEETAGSAESQHSVDSDAADVYQVSKVRNAVGKIPFLRSFLGPEDKQQTRSSDTEDPYIDSDVEKVKVGSAPQKARNNGAKPKGPVSRKFPLGVPQPLQTKYTTEDEEVEVSDEELEAQSTNVSETTPLKRRHEAAYVDMSQPNIQQLLKNLDYTPAKPSSPESSDVGAFDQVHTMVFEPKQKQESSSYENVSRKHRGGRKGSPVRTLIPKIPKMTYDDSESSSQYNSPNYGKKKYPGSMLFRKQPKLVANDAALSQKAISNAALTNESSGYAKRASKYSSESELSKNSPLVGKGRNTLVVDNIDSDISSSPIIQKRHGHKVWTKPRLLQTIEMQETGTSAESDGGRGGGETSQVSGISHLSALTMPSRIDAEYGGSSLPPGTSGDLGDSAFDERLTDASSARRSGSRRSGESWIDTRVSPGTDYLKLIQQCVICGKYFLIDSNPTLNRVLAAISDIPIHDKAAKRALLEVISKHFPRRQFAPCGSGRVGRYASLVAPPCMASQETEEQLDVYGSATPLLFRRDTGETRMSEGGRYSESRRYGIECADYELVRLEQEEYEQMRRMPRVTDSSDAQTQTNEHVLYTIAECEPRPVSKQERRDQDTSASSIPTSEHVPPVPPQSDPKPGSGNSHGSGKQSKSSTPTIPSWLHERHSATSKSSAVAEDTVRTKTIGSMFDEKDQGSTGEDIGADILDENDTGSEKYTLVRIPTSKPALPVKPTIVIDSSQLSMPSESEGSPTPSTEKEVKVAFKSAEKLVQQPLLQSIPLRRSSQDALPSTGDESEEFEEPSELPMPEYQPFLKPSFLAFQKNGDTVTTLDIVSSEEDHSTSEAAAVQQRQEEPPAAPDAASQPSLHFERVPFIDSDSVTPVDVQAATYQELYTDTFDRVSDPVITAPPITSQDRDSVTPMGDHHLVDDIQHLAAIPCIKIDSGRSNSFSPRSSLSDREDASSSISSEEDELSVTRQTTKREIVMVCQKIQRVSSPREGGLFSTSPLTGADIFDVPPGGELVVSPNGEDISDSSTYTSTRIETVQSRTEIITTEDMEASICEELESFADSLSENLPHDTMLDRPMAPLPYSSQPPEGSQVTKTSQIIVSEGRPVVPHSPPYIGPPPYAGKPPIPPKDYRSIAGLPPRPALRRPLVFKRAEVGNQRKPRAPEPFPQAAITEVEANGGREEEEHIPEHSSEHIDRSSTEPSPAHSGDECASLKPSGEGVDP